MGDHRAPRPERRPAADPPAGAASRTARPARPASSSRFLASNGAAAQDLLDLQRVVGNAAVTHVVQRVGEKTKIETLDGYLDQFNTPENKVIDLLGTMSPTEKRTVLTGYRDKLSSALDFGEMKRALANLAPVELPVQLDWLQKASMATRAISYGEISKLVNDAAQPERDMLKNARWREFFTSVCDNKTIIPAVRDLRFDLVTQLAWVKDEASGHNLVLGDLMPLLAPVAPFPPRTPAELAAISTDTWRSYWVDVCTNETMPQLVDVLFPQSLVTKLEWMEIEGSKLSYVVNKVTATQDAAQKLAVFGSARARSLAVSVCSDKEMIQLVLELGGEWNLWKPWVLAEGAPLRDLGLAAVAKGSITGEIDKRFLTWVTADEADTAYRRLGTFGDTDLAVLRLGPMPADVIRDRYGGQAEKVLRALNGELAREAKKVTTDEKLLSGPTTEPFKEKSFGGDKRFTLSYWRDRVEVEVGVSMTAADDRAKSQLGTAKATWSSGIAGAWNGFELTNARRTIPMQMKVSFEGGPNSVKVHSGPWVWPKFNAGNWYIPDTEQVPGQADANTKAPIHEFGHLIGNLDEYSASAEHFVQVTGSDPSRPGRSPSIVEETDTEGTKRYTDTGSVMGTGGSGPALARHVDHIVTWVNQNLQAGEPPFTLRARGAGGGP